MTRKRWAAWNAGGPMVGATGIEPVTPYHVKKACEVEAVENQGTRVAVSGTGGTLFQGRSASRGRLRPTGTTHKWHSGPQFRVGVTR
jgi:hypothetical protein